VTNPAQTNPAQTNPAQTNPAQSNPTRVKITQVRSAIGGKQNQRATLHSLGLRKIRQSVERDDTPQIRGMIKAVRHLVTVEEVAP
jgi:large subunit ribosomal protein L30